MMSSVNLIGNLGANPEIKTFQSGKRVARFPLAMNRYGKDKDLSGSLANCGMQPWTA